jgi:hypothetical protein
METRAVQAIYTRTKITKPVPGTQASAEITTAARTLATPGHKGANQLHGLDLWTTTAGARKRLVFMPMAFIVLSAHQTNIHLFAKDFRLAITITKSASIKSK